MKLKELIKSEYETYKTVEKEITQWVEEAYPGLSMEFGNHRVEIVRTNELLDFDVKRVNKIVEVINIKIDEILESHDEELYLASLLERIWKKHPQFNIEVSGVEELKSNKKFLRFLKELHV